MNGVRPRTAWLVWLASRIIAVLSMGLPRGSYVPSDLHLFASWADEIAHGSFIATDAWQYPPGVTLVLAITGVTHHAFGLLLAVIVGCDAALMSRFVGTRGAMLWASAGLLIGPLLVTRLDTLVTLAAVLGLTASSASRSGILLGLGTSLKLWPALLISAPRGRVLPRLLAAAGAYLAVAILARTLVSSPSFVGNQQARGLQVESLAAWPFMVARALGLPVRLVFRNGATEVAGELADTIARWLLPAGLLAAGVVVLWAWRTIGSPDTGAAALISLQVVLVLLVTSRVLSPQFNIWILGLGALALAHGRGSRPLVLSLAGTAVAAQVLYPSAYADFLTGGRTGLVVQSIRLVLLVLAMVATTRCLRHCSGDRPAPRAPVRVGDSPANAAAQASTASARTH